MKTILFLVLVAVIQGTSGERVLFSDTFNRPDSTWLGLNDNGLGGSLQTPYFQRYSYLYSNKVVFAGMTQWFAMDHNWIDIDFLKSNGLKIEFDCNPGGVLSPAPSDPTKADWIACSIGATYNGVSNSSINYYVLIDY